MAARGDFIKRAYGLTTPEDTQALYSEWATTYDRDLASLGYATPSRCAKALARHAPAKDIAVLDIGCGTGLSGKALAAEGFTDLTGSDVNPAMLEVARGTGVYRDTWVADPSDPFPFAPGTYGAITAVGVIGVGAAPLSVLERMLPKLAPGGLAVFSFNDHTLEDPDFEACVTQAVASGCFELASKDYGPHIPAMGFKATVNVLRRTG